MTNILSFILSLLKLLKQFKAPLIFTLLYLIPSAIFYVSQGNGEFIWYVAVVFILMTLVIITLPYSRFGQGIVWGLSVWGLLHMAGGTIQVGEGVLYALQLIPIYSSGTEMIILKFDQALHAYGFGLSAIIIFHFLKRWIDNPYRFGVYFVAVLAAMGMGVINEIIEFVVTMLFPDNGVGGYINTSLDLVFNSIGAVIAMIIVDVFHKNKK